MKIKQSVHIRPLSPSDIQAIMTIQSACYPSALLEDAAHLVCKQQQSPSSCWVATKECEVVAYLFSHPWCGDTPPDLNSVLPPANTQQPIYYLHDLAVHPQARGLGLAQQLIDTALSWAKQHAFAQIRLIAVAGAAPFWLKQGFKPVFPLNEQILNKLSGYGPDTHYLEVMI
ncbi:ribosomal protein S18 acetylase RimI-like enzyme [Iodobacter fluviatilis]|uniref:Predicted acetyltransferase n=2 Tax=Iodobacter fluviatilis TaxID=537 RepID=A0A377Q8I6_9NEIS|nr:ribosomal protein S18 acetylase RimI-like enzyme [Iodobacter fluviatilis]STQ91223.1 Predicted acetyltransferase [Iodobacter fluviatilis]